MGTSSRRIEPILGSGKLPQKRESLRRAVKKRAKQRASHAMESMHEDQKAGEEPGRMEELRRFQND